MLTLVVLRVPFPGHEVQTLRSVSSMMCSSPAAARKARYGSAVVAEPSGRSNPERREGTPHLAARRVLAAPRRQIVHTDVVEPANPCHGSRLSRVFHGMQQATYRCVPESQPRHHVPQRIAFTGPSELPLNLLPGERMSRWPGCTGTPAIAGQPVQRTLSSVACAGTMKCCAISVSAGATPNRAMYVSGLLTVRVPDLGGQTVGISRDEEHGSVRCVSRGRQPVRLDASRDRRRSYAPRARALHERGRPMPDPGENRPIYLDSSGRRNKL